MIIELGKLYVTRDGKYAVRIISTIGKWSKLCPVVGELYELVGKRKIFSEGMFFKYEHWSKSGSYLSTTDSEMDLVEEYVEKAKTTAKV